MHIFKCECNININNISLQLKQECILFKYKQNIPMINVKLHFQLCILHNSAANVVYFRIPSK